MIGQLEKLESRNDEEKNSDHSVPGVESIQQKDNRDAGLD